MTLYGQPVAMSAGQAQQLLDEHVARADNGRCMRCGEIEPCAPRIAALRLFWAAPMLPRRIPGLSRPELIGARWVR